MTETEAIKLVNEIYNQCCDTSNILCTSDADKKCEALCMAIKALEEVQKYRTYKGNCMIRLLTDDDAEKWEEYRAIGTPEELQDMKNDYVEALSDWRQYRKIGTLEECRAAVEKQTAKKVIHNNTMNIYFCPVCERKANYMHSLYCSGCGQKLDWSDEG